MSSPLGDRLSVCALLRRPCKVRRHVGPPARVIGTRTSMREASRVELKRQAHPLRNFRPSGGRNRPEAARATHYPLSGRVKTILARGLSVAAHRKYGNWFERPARGRRRQSAVTSADTSTIHRQNSSVPAAQGPVGVLQLAHFIFELDRFLQIPSTAQPLPDSGHMTELVAC